MSQQFSRYLGYNCNKICCQELLKITHSGHTALGCSTHKKVKRGHRPLKREGHVRASEYAYFISPTMREREKERKREREREVYGVAAWDNNKAARLRTSSVCFFVERKGYNEDKESGKGHTYWVHSLERKRVRVREILCKSKDQY